MNKTIVIFTLAMTIFSAARSQTIVLADFEDGTYGQLKLNKDYTGSLFSKKPSIIDNPDTTGINTSSKCLSATNVADADWWKNFLILELTTPVIINDTNRILTLLTYRSIQPKAMRIGFNSYEESATLYEGSLDNDATWQRLSLDMGESFLGKTLSSIYIILSCNWSDPRSGWGEAMYCFDDIALGPAGGDDDVSISLRPSITYQTISSFGASDCWTAEYVADYFNTTEKEKAATWLFSSDIDESDNPKGIALSSWRVNIGAGSATQGDDSNISDETRRVECFLNADGTYDWTRQDGQQYFMQKAHENGVDRFILFANSAPIYYTKNGKANANNVSVSCNLADSHINDFALFLATTAKHFQDAGYNITAVSPLNETQWDWKDGQEGMPMENSDITTLVKYLDTQFTTLGVKAEIMLPEAASWLYLYGGSNRGANQISDLFDTSSSLYVGDLSNVMKGVAAHSYWTFTTNDALVTYRKNAWAAASARNLKVIQSEWSMLDDAPSSSAAFPESYADASKMDIALYMAKVIYSDLAYANVSAWHYWTAFEQEKYSQKNRFYLLRLNATGDSDDESYGSLKNGGTVSADKNLWVLGNYSRFVRPGSTRIDVSDADELNGLMGTAFLSADGQQISLVLVNMSSRAKTVRLNLKDDWTVSNHKAYLTDTDHDLALSGSVTSPQSFSVPKQSVMTLVLDVNNPNTINAVNTDDNTSGSHYLYNINGQRVSESYHGIVVKNDKKVLQ